MSVKSLLQQGVLVAAALRLASCGSGSESGSDILRLVNPLNAQLTVTGGFPNGSTQTVAVPTSGLTPERLLKTHYAFWGHLHV